ncbi:MAG: hypothetical protein JRI31_09785 [Deltaproteobacteria bacterium]|nr:hypothetical protein [Deltaproteobacteria bacterium]
MRSKIRVPIFITLATTPVVVFTVGYAMAHGVMGSVEVHEGVRCVKARYSTGDVMNYDRVKVFSPKLKIPFQVGWDKRNSGLAL